MHSQINEKTFRAAYPTNPDNSGAPATDIFGKTIGCFWDPEARFTGMLLVAFEHWCVGTSVQQHTLGCCIILSRHRARNLWDLPAAAHAEYAYLQQVIRNALAGTSILTPDNINYLQLQNVEPHLHLHCVPRYHLPRFFSGRLWRDAAPRKPVCWLTEDTPPEELQSVHRLLGEALRKELMSSASLPAARGESMLSSALLPENSRMSASRDRKDSVRAILFDAQGNLLLMRREKPGRAPYYVFIGGGVEPEDLSFEKALLRELKEEIGAKVLLGAKLLSLASGEPRSTDPTQHFYLARLISLQESDRCAPEFSIPERGTYQVIKIDPHSAEFATLPVQPSAAHAFVVAHSAMLQTSAREDLVHVRGVWRKEWPSIERSMLGVGSIALIPALVSGEIATFTAGQGGGTPSDTLMLPTAETDPILANFWLSTYRSPDPAVALRFFRSASLVHNGEQDVRVRQVRSACYVRQLASAARSMRTLEATQPVSRLICINLLSGNSVHSSDQQEYFMAQEQEAALVAHLNDADRSVPLALHHFIVPVHEQLYKQRNAWPLAPLHRERLEELLRDATRLLGGTGRGKFVIERIKLLLKCEEQEEATPCHRYALAAHLVMLGNLMGAVVHINCRSGKDRTGLVDVESKFLGFQLFRFEQGLQVSEAAGDVLTEERPAWRFFLLNGGNSDVQELNTGVRGSQLNHESIRRRIGEDLWKEFLSPDFTSRT